MSEEKQKRNTTVALNPQLAREARILAVTNGETLRAFTEEAVSRYIELRRKETNTNTTTANTANTSKGK